MKIGEQVQVKKGTNDGQHIYYTGIFNGRVKSNGGWKNIVTLVGVLPNQVIGVRKVKKIQNENQ